MTHQYRQPIAMTVSASGDPGAFTWRGRTYHVVEVLARWHLRDRWWEPHASTRAAAQPIASNRHYYRLRCAEGMLCEVYWDAAVAAWTLDRVID